MVAHVAEHGSREGMPVTTWPNAATLSMIEIREVSWALPADEHMELEEFARLYGDPVLKGNKVIFLVNNMLSEFRFLFQRSSLPSHALHPSIHSISNTPSPPRPVPHPASTLRLRLRSAFCILHPQSRHLPHPASRQHSSLRLS